MRGIESAGRHARGGLLSHAECMAQLTWVRAGDVSYGALLGVPSCSGGAMTSARAVGGELRQVTAVFSDLSGYTAMSEKLDPEDIRKITEPVFEIAAEVIERYGGRIDK